jgi:septum site-determining protein MinD
MTAVAVCGGKGGVGKTTLALGLGRALTRTGAEAEAGAPPLVVDADADVPDLAHYAAVAAEPGVDAVAGGAPIDDVATPSQRLPGVAVLPATPGADVRGALGALPTERPVVLDCPGGAGPDAVAPLRAADRALVVTTTHPPAVADAARTARIARALGTPLAAVAVTRIDAVPPRIERRFDRPTAAIPAAPDPVESERLTDGCAELLARIRPNG